MEDEHSESEARPGEDRTSSQAPIPLGLVIGQLVHGGAERQLHALVRGLDRTRFRPVVYCLSELSEPYGPWLKAAGVEVVLIPRRRHYDAGRILRLASDLRRRRIHILHAFLLEASVYAALASVLAGTPVLITSNRVALPGRDGLRKRFDRWAFNRSARVLVNSHAVRTFTEEIYGLSADRMVVVYNGLDPELYETAVRDPVVRRDLGAGESDLLVGTVGRIMPQKNPTLFLDVVERVAREVPRARFVWIGKGDLRQQLLDNARVRRLESVVQVPGTRDDIPQVLASLDLFVLTSNAEGLPNVVLEAMAAGRAVVATDAGGTAEAVGPAGVVRPLGDAAGLAEHVVKLLKDAEARSRMGEAARSRIRSHFTVTRMVAATQAMYEEVIGESKTGG